MFFLPNRINGLGLVFVAINLLFHLAAALKGFLRLTQRALRLGVPSERQAVVVSRVYDQMHSAYRSAQRRLRTPRSFCYSPDPDLKIGWVGHRLIIHDSLLKSQFLPPLLMHELAHYNSADLWLRLALKVLPPPGGGVGVFAGV